MGHVSGAGFTRAGFNHLINQGDLGLRVRVGTFPWARRGWSPGVAFMTGNHESESRITLQVDANALV